MPEETEFLRRPGRNSAFPVFQGSYSLDGKYEGTPSQNRFQKNTFLLLAREEIQDAVQL